MSTSPTPPPHPSYAGQPAASTAPVPVQVVQTDGRPAPVSEPRHKDRREEVRIYNHSTFF
jgi:hypothetical protein